MSLDLLKGAPLGRRQLLLLACLAGVVATGVFLCVAWMLGEAQALGPYTPFLWGIVLLLGGVGLLAGYLGLGVAVWVCGLSLMGFAFGDWILQDVGRGIGATLVADYWDPVRGGRLSRPEGWACFILGLSLCAFQWTRNSFPLLVGSALLGAMGMVGVWGAGGLVLWMQDFGGAYAWSALSIGTLLMAAVGMAVLGLLRATNAWRGLAFTVGLAGVVFSLGGWNGLVHQERLIAQEMVAVQNQDLRRLFETRLATQLQPLVRMANRWREFGRVEGRSWKRETVSFMDHFPAYLRVVWVGPNYKVRQESRKAGLWAEGEAAILLDPGVKLRMKANQSAHRPWLMRRQDLLDGGIFLQAHQPVFLQSKFEGHLIAVLRLDEVVRTILRDRPLPGYSFSLTQGEEVIWERVESTKHLRLASVEEVDLSGVPLSLSVWPNPEQIVAYRSFVPEGILVLGLGWTVLLAWLIWTVGKLKGRAIEAERMNEFLSASDDQTRRESLELMRAREEAQRASQHKSEFLASMSHEIRTPLNVLVGVSDLMKGTKLTKVQKEYVQILRSASSTLLSNINDVLDFSKIESGKLDLVERPFELKRLVEDTCTMFSHMAEERGLTFDLIYDPEISQWVIGDVDRLRQVLNNLTSNALKYTQEGGVVLRVEQQQDGQIRIEVEDSGIGIPEEEKEQIFEVFHQVGGHMEGGSGLGLSISQRLVNLMGSSIICESQAGEGSVFYFTLSLPPTEGVMGTGARTKKSRSRSKPKILVAEDNPLNQKVIRAQLESLGFAPTIVPDGEKAVAAVKKRNFQVLLMDCRMPGMDGYTAARKIREWETESGKVRTPIIALTAHATAEDEALCADSGMGGYLTKPVSMDRLSSALRQATEAPTPRKAPAKGKKKKTAAVEEDFPTLDRSMLFSLHLLESDDGFLGELVEIFAETAPKSGERAMQEARRENLHGVVDEVHSLKSAAANLGARRLVWMCEQIEEMGGHGDVYGVREFLPKLLLEISAVLEALQGEIEPSEAA